MNKILIRADASSSVGTGHVMRCLVLAKRFRQRNIIVEFLCKDLLGNNYARLKEEGFLVHLFSANTLDEELLLLNQVLHQEVYQLLVIDHYAYHASVEKKIKAPQNTKLLVIDDLFSEHICDYLLNQNIYAGLDDYQELVPQETKLFLGYQYALLRDEFLALSPNARTLDGKETLRVLVTLGGGDFFDLYKDIILVLANANRSFHVDLLFVQMNAYVQSIVDLFNNYKLSFQLHINAQNIALLMQQADFAITAAGTTILETLHLQLPSIIIKVADNQSRNIEFIKAHQLGSVISGIDETFSNKLKEQLNELLLEDNFTKICHNLSPYLAKPKDCVDEII